MNSKPIQNNSIELQDPSYCNYLLAEYEKHRAAENNSNIDLLNTSEYQQYLASFGNSAIQYYSHQIEQRERNLQLMCDQKILEYLRYLPGEQILKRFHGFISQETYFNLIVAQKASQELMNRINEIQDENAKLEKELEKISQES